MNALKHARKELAAGSGVGAPVERLATVSPDVIAFRRGGVIVAVNLGKEAAKPFKKAPSVKGMADWMTGTVAKIPAKLAPGEYLILTSAE